MESKKFSSIAEYLDSMPENVQDILKKLIKLGAELVPEAEETISYGIPTLKLNGKYMVYFAGYKEHVSVYPFPKTDENLAKEFEQYVHGQGTLRFPIDEEIPYDLIKSVIKVLEKENKERTKKY